MKWLLISLVALCALLYLKGCGGSDHAKKSDLKEVKLELTKTIEKVVKVQEVDRKDLKKTNDRLLKTIKTLDRESDIRRENDVRHDHILKQSGVLGLAQRTKVGEVASLKSAEELMADVDTKLANVVGRDEFNKQVRDYNAGQKRRDDNIEEINQAIGAMKEGIRWAPQNPERDDRGRVIERILDKNVKVVESVTPGTLRRIPDRGPGVPQVYAYITEHGGTPGLFGWFWVKQFDGQTCGYVWRETWLPVTKNGDIIVFPENLQGYHAQVEVKDFPAHPSQYTPKPNALPRPQPLPELKKPVPPPPKPPVHPAPPPAPKEVKPPTSAPTSSPPKVATNHRVWNWSVGKDRLAESNPEAIAAGIHQRQAVKSLRPTATGQPNR